MRRLMSLAAALFALSSQAAEPEVAVQADVVFASTKAGTVEPALLKMQTAMAPKIQYQTLKTLATSKLALKAQQPQSVSLPNQKRAQLTMQALRANVATLKVKLEPAEAVYSLGREKSLYVQGGAHEGGELWLVLSQPQ